VTAPSTPDKLGLASIVAIGIGGMVGGGIFAVLGLAMSVSGHAVALTLGLGGLIALLTGLSYAHLGLCFRDDGGSFTYIEEAFGGTAVAGVAGWVLVAGYAGTLALYASAFGNYGAALLTGSDSRVWLSTGLAMAVLLAFLVVNLLGARTSGGVELAIVIGKLLILLVFAAVGLATVQSDHLLPVFNKGPEAPLIATALIFVAYEGFELIPNAVDEMKHPERDLKRGLVLAILITTAVYIGVGVVALGNLTSAQVEQSREYVLAVAAQPTLGHVGFVLIGLAALMSTGSAINATLFGSARLAMVMASEHALPRIFSMRERTRPVPWVALVALTVVTAVFTVTSDLGVIASFASATFLLIFAAVNLAAFRLRRTIGMGVAAPLAGSVLSLACFAGLMWHIGTTDGQTLFWIATFYLSAVVAEVGLSLWRGRRQRQPRPARG
jgi:amino acid transporter